MHTYFGVTTYNYFTVYEKDGIKIFKKMLQNSIELLNDKDDRHVRPEITKFHRALQRA